ncbi:hypothetical protein G9C98_007663 [Cotesia typhae]|uniref:Proteasome subunit alpha type n=1 Tax=Cotesia typhae TaxID=2053667 RepID=A0A8J5QSY0_9HYME|nr:hypothetical protein G9C98_007663 [Cotesia typhae]
MSARYDRAITVFSPDGHLLQVEYAQEAVRKGSTAVGVRGNDVVVLGVEKKVLINRAQIECQSHKLTVEDAVAIEYITRHVAGLKQKYTQSNGRRPFGISCLIAGFDYDGSPHLFQTEPSGIYHEWKANATGRAAKTVKEFLEKYYTPEEVATERGSIKLAIRALLEVVTSGQKNLEIAIMRRNEPMQMLDSDTIGEYVTEIEKEKEAEAEKKKQKK